MKMKENIQALGGILVCLLIPILILCIWIDWVIMLKILATDIVLIIGLLLADKATD